MTTQMKLFTNGEFDALYRKLRSDDDMVAVMRRMQEDYGIGGLKADKNADTIIQMVAAHENAVNMLSDDAQAMLDEFLNEMSGRDRKALLHQLHFGLKMYQDEELIERFWEGTDEYVLFGEYYARYGKDPTITEAMLEDEIRKLMGGNWICPKAMRHVVRQMEQSQDLRATAAELGEEGMRFKAIVAMDLYLRNKDTMTAEEAAQIACTNVELQAVADGLAQGQITEEQTKKIIAVILLLCLITFLAMEYYQIPNLTDLIERADHMINIYDHPAVIEGEKKRIETLKLKKEISVWLKWGSQIGGFALSVVSNKVPGWMGQFAAKRTFVRTAKEANTAAAMERFCDNLKASTAKTVVGQAPARKAQVETKKQYATLGTM